MVSRPRLLRSNAKQPADLQGHFTLKRKWLVVEGTDGHGLRIEHDVRANPGIEEEVSREAPDVSAAYRENGAAPARTAPDTPSCSMLLCQISTPEPTHAPSNCEPNV
jgi:hypothetical protein